VKLKTALSAPFFIAASQAAGSAGGHKIALFCLVGECAGAFDQLQVVVVCEVEYEAISHWFYIVELSVYENGFFVVVMAGAYIARVFHFLFGTERRKNAAESFGPVAGAKFFAVACPADNDEWGIGGESHGLAGSVKIDFLEALMTIWPAGILTEKSISCRCARARCGGAGGESGLVRKEIDTCLVFG